MIEESVIREVKRLDIVEVIVDFVSVKGLVLVIRL